MSNKKNSLGGYVSNGGLEGIVLLCEFMEIRPVIYGRNSYGWSDGVHYRTHEESSQAVMINIWNYVAENKVMDWRWLMSVVEKIESIRDDDKFYNFQILGGSSIYVISSDMRVVVDVDGCSKMDAVYKGCVSFVKWYNANVK